MSVPLTALSLLLAAAAASADDGRKVYQKLCASCHGADGEGTKDHPDPLAGNRTLDKLTLYIEKNMPEDKPGTCVGEDAKKVAKYVYDAFYSRAAQARQKPPRVELARLTVRQYRNALADLLGTFSEPGRWDERRGLRAEYFATRRIRDGRGVLERVDRAIQFAFGATSPAEKVPAEEYAIRWSGAVFAPDTGEYEFIVETENGVRLWVNDSERALLDAWVRSGSDKRHKETLYLLGGRVYPIRVEFFKAKQDKTASIALRWKRPQRAEEPIPEGQLSPAKFPEAPILHAPFPPDDRSLGYERSTSISKAWDESATHGALEVAAYVTARLGSWTDRKPDGVRQFCRRFAERAFRRPLKPDEQQFFVDRHFEEGDLGASVKKVVLLVLKSPRFLYHDIDPQASDAYDVASRISFGLWDSLPDREILEAARTGGLDSPEGIARQVERMIPDLRTQAKVREFYHQWLQLDRLQELSKDARRFPEFNEVMVSDLRTSLDLFLDDVTWGEASDFRQLLLAESIFLNGRLARFYGGDLPPEGPFQKVTPGPRKHAGILTHPLLMAGFAYDATSSPIHRGIFVARSLLGKRLRPPQDAVTPLSPDLHPDLTTRERIALQTRPQACQSCHAMVNPLGFALEHFDAVGRYRDSEKGKPIDATGSYGPPDGDAVQFTGARELGEFLAKSEETQAAFVEHLFHYFVKQPVRAYGVDRPEALRKDFVATAFSIRKLLVQVIVTSSGQGKKP